MIFLTGAALGAPLAVGAQAPTVHHFVFFGGEREQVRTDSAFLATKNVEGAQIIYTWRALEPGKDEYDFSAIREDLAFLGEHGKKLWIQLQDVSFSESVINVPRYLRNDSTYHGGAARQYAVPNGDESKAKGAGWVARRWDPAVQDRLQKLFVALGREFDGRIEGINLAESSVEFGESGKLYPSGFSPVTYRDALIENMKALKEAFPKSIAMQYANFMPGEWRPTEDKGFLTAVYKAAISSGVGVGGPDLMLNRPGHVKGSHPLLREAAGRVPTGLAVQDGNLEEVNPSTGKPVTALELFRYGRDSLRLDYIFWGRQEPYYSSDIVPMLTRAIHGII